MSTSPAIKYFYTLNMDPYLDCHSKIFETESLGLFKYKRKSFAFVCVCFFFCPFESEAKLVSEGYANLEEE